MMRLALAEWVKFVDISQLSVALHCNSLPRFIDTGGPRLVRFLGPQQTALLEKPH